MKSIKRASPSLLTLATLTLTTFMLSLTAYPQACGSVLHQDITLTANIGPCPGTALNAENHITINLNGFTISGQGAGDGILAGGNGVNVFGPGTITNFRNGVRVLTGEVANPNVISGLNLTGNGTGITIPEGSGFSRIIENNITGGSIGVFVSQSGAKIKGNVITNNSGTGIQLLNPAFSVAIVDNTVNENNVGLLMDSPDMDFADTPVTVLCSDFSGNNSTGVTMRGSRITFETSTVGDNGGDGMVLSTNGLFPFPGSSNLIQDNIVEANAGNGISLVNASAAGIPNQVVDNKASGNGVFDLNWDQAGNTSCWKLNDFGTSNPAALPSCP